MKNNYLRLTLGVWLLCLTHLSFAQMSVTGRATDTEGEAVIGATIMVKYTSQGTITDYEGNFELMVPNGEAILVASYLGMKDIAVPVEGRNTINIIMEEDAAQLSEVVVIGYGTQKKKDLTGSIQSITSENFVKGQLTTPEQLIAGKLPGVLITSNGGNPGSGSRIRIRGGSSLNASNDPLIVLDGIPLDNTGISGSANALNMINPADIESITVLKDASATAIYGSRASNGVLIINTKRGERGGKRLAVSFNSQVGVSSVVNTVPVLSGDEFRAVVNEQGNAAQKAILGTENTDWQSLIYQDAMTYDNNLTFNGFVKNTGYRVSLGYLDQQGVLKTNHLGRSSLAVGLTPTFFDRHLKVDLNLKTSQTRNQFADAGAIGSAAFFDPTKPVYSGQDTLFGYYEWVKNGKPDPLAPKNPLALLELKDDQSTNLRSIASAMFDYKFHFLPELRANLNIGIDRSGSNGDVFTPRFSSLAFETGEQKYYNQEKDNRTLDFYLNYVRENNETHRFDIMGGYSYQDYKNDGYNVRRFLSAADTLENIPFFNQYTLVSFFGRLNYSLLNKYLFTATMRLDGSSRFSPENRWGQFPSLAFAWRASEEGFLRNSAAISDLKVRLGYGITGQQDVGRYYPYLPTYVIGENTASYQLGDQFINTIRPDGYDENIKWEQTTTYNAGVDYDLFNGLFFGSLDVYQRETDDLLAEVAVPAGSNLTNRILTNIGSLENRGFEFIISTNLIRKEKMNWTVGFNASANRSKLTNLSLFEGQPSPNILVGGISGGVGNNVQIHTVGFQPNMFYLFEQLYDETGKPLQGQYADADGSGGAINDDDRRRFHNPEPRYFVGLNSQFSYGPLTIGFVSRANLGNFVYNNMRSNSAVFKPSSLSFLNNVHENYLTTGFDNNQYFSDYYLEDASFFRMDNINLGYTLPKLAKDKISIGLTLNVQNAFVLTKYSGIDPEIAGGIDNNFYPRPRAFIFGLSLGF